MSQRDRAYYKSHYIEGSSVRKIQPVPGRPEQNRDRRREIHTGRRAALPMNGISVLFLAGISVLCILMCVLYLSVQSGISKTRSDISGLKTKISTLQSQNDALSYSINSHINTDYIYKIAKNRLGMKQAGENQIITYHSSDDGYMIQYGDIPEK